LISFCHGFGPAVDPTEAAEQRALEIRLERSGVLLAYEIVL
jgi:hypothetical protein